MAGGIRSRMQLLDVERGTDTPQMLSIPHLVVIFLVALVVLGPEKLPQVARMLGKAMADFRRITSDFRGQIEDEIRKWSAKRA